MARQLVDVINEYCYRQLGVFPNLERPKGYNDKINWLKLYDQMADHVTCCNKLLARAYVAERCAPGCLLGIYQISKSVDQIEFDVLPERFVLKSNHDSGTVHVITERRGLRRLKREIRRSLKRTYGLNTGEWAYSHISPYVFAEEYMPGPIVDYKFHCSLGQIFWVQIIADRASGTPKETIVDEHYTNLPLHMDHKMVHEPQGPPRPSSWGGMRALARKLSEPFRYVRVDLYHYQDRAVFGELTFWPLAGCYKTKDEPVFGQMLDIDTCFKRPIIHDVVHKQRSLRRAIKDLTRKPIPHFPRTTL